MKKRYRILFAVLRPFAALLYPTRHKGLEKVPEGPAVICANHSSLIDPVLLALVFGGEHYMHFMAKKELFGIPFLGWVLGLIGAVKVERNFGVGAIRAAMRFLKNGDKIMIFPEGTRVEKDDAVAAKSGAVRMARKMKAPIVPVYIPRRKKPFSRIEISIGEPYFVESAEANATNIDYQRLSGELMEKIYALRPNAS